MSLLHHLHLLRPDVKKILLVESCNRDLVVNAFRSGVRGVFCFTELPFRRLCRCVPRVAFGKIGANNRQVQDRTEAISQVPCLRVVTAQGSHILTGREEQVVALVAEGLSNREIAAELHLSAHTVKKYMLRIFDKLGSPLASNLFFTR